MRCLTRPAPSWPGRMYQAPQRHLPFPLQKGVSRYVGTRDLRVATCGWNQEIVSSSKILPMRKLFLFLLLLVGLGSFAQSRYVSEATKKVVFARDGGICQCCGSSSDLEFDHITPFSCGGSNDRTNIQLLCRQCNRSKSNSCTCKVHQKVVGTNCCDGRSSSGTATKSTSTARQCTGTTKKGLRCKNRTTNANGRCHHH